MTLAIELSDETQRQLEIAASQQGLAPAEVAAQILRRELSGCSPRQDAAELLQSWIDTGDAEQQRKTYDYLTRTLDEDRPAERKLFPPELKGVTW